MHIRGFYEKKRSSSVNKKMITEEKLGHKKKFKIGWRRNVFVTQTTLSLVICGNRPDQGQEKWYGVLCTSKWDRKDWFGGIFCLIIWGVARAEFTLVLHTKLGEASVLANIVDANKDEWILGTVAGANTLLVICRDQHVAKPMEDRLLDLMKDK